MDPFAASLRNGLLRLNWAPGIFVTYEIAVHAARTLEKIGGHQTLPILVNITGITGVELDARAAMKAYRGFSRIAIVGDHPMGMVLSAFARQSAAPTVYFADEEAALYWIADQNDTMPTSSASFLGQPG